MKHTTTITMDYEVFIEAKKRYTNFSGTIEGLVKADLSLGNNEPKDLKAAQEMLKRHEIAVSAIKAKVENLEKQKEKEKTQNKEKTLIISGGLGDDI